MALLLTASIAFVAGFILAAGAQADAIRTGHATWSSPLGFFGDVLVKSLILSVMAVTAHLVIIGISSLI